MIFVYFIIKSNCKVITCKKLKHSLQLSLCMFNEVYRNCIYIICPGIPEVNLTVLMGSYLVHNLSCILVVKASLFKRNMFGLIAMH